MPVPVRVARVVIVVQAVLVALLAGAVALVGFTARDIGALVGAPALLGIVGLVLALRIGPGRRAVRIGIVVVEAFWALLALGAVGQGDPTGVVALPLAIAVIVLVAVPSAGRYWRDVGSLGPGGGDRPAIR